VLGHVHCPQHGDRREPHHHDRSEHPADRRRAATLDQEQADQDDHRGRYHEGVEIRGGDRRALHGGEYRDGRGDDAIAIEQRRAEQADEHEHPAAPPHWWLPRRDECRQGQDAALTVVVGPHHDGEVLDADDEYERPEHEGQQAEDVVLDDRQLVAVSLERLPHGEQRVGADVAEDHAQGAEGQSHGAGVGGVAVPSTRRRAARARRPGALALLR
jgi:hypothetical protein